MLITRRSWVRSPRWPFFFRGAVQLFILSLLIPGDPHPRSSRSSMSVPEPPPTSPLKLPSALALAIADFSKPYKHEASLRLRNSSLSLLALLLLTALVQLPSPFRAWRVVGGSVRGVSEWLWWTCAVGTQFVYPPKKVKIRQLIFGSVHACRTDHRVSPIAQYPPVALRP